jgi:hypothetical protein
MECCIDGIQFPSYATREVIKEIVCENGRRLLLVPYLVDVVPIKCITFLIFKTCKILLLITIDWQILRFRPIFRNL